MAEYPTQQPLSPRSPTNDRHDQLVEYWCHQCNKRVTGVTLDNNQFVCSQCNDGFLVAIAPSPSDHSDILQQFMQDLNIQNNERTGVPGGIDLNMRAASLLSRFRQIYRERVQVLGTGSVGNIGDYADEAEYQSILLNLAESDDGGNRGAPPAAESAVAALKNLKIESENEAVVCVVCKDMVAFGETGKELPCGHGYHADCIVTWLATRNMCPVCRYELPTSDPDYEEERIKKNSGAAAGSPKAGNYVSDE